MANAIGIEGTLEDVTRVTFEVTQGEIWQPLAGESYWVPNLQEFKGEPFERLWEGGRNEVLLLQARRVHRKELQAFRQQVELHKALFLLTA